MVMMVKVRRAGFFALLCAGVCLGIVPIGVCASNPLCPPYGETPPGPNVCPNCCGTGGAAGGIGGLNKTNECSLCKNSPVYVQAGVPTTEATDLVVPGPGLPLVLSRAYTGSSQHVGLLGFGWLTPFEESIAIESDGTNCFVRLARKNGEYLFFTESPCGSGQFNAAETAPWVLVRDVPAPGKWSLIKQDGSQQTFNGSGYLETVSNAEGESLQFGYGAGNALMTVTDPRRPGRSLRFNYGPNGFVDSVDWETGSGMRTVTYGRDANTGDLTEVATADGWTEIIAYQTDAAHLCQVPHLITSVRRGLPGVAYPPMETNVYSTNLQLLDKTERGRTVHWEYLDNTDPNVLQGITLETWLDTNNNTQTKKVFTDAWGRITKIERREGAVLKTTEQRLYDQATGLMTDAQGADGLWTHTVHDGLGHVTAISRGCTSLGCPNGQGLTWHYTYETINGVPRLTRTEGPADYGKTIMAYYGQNPPQGGLPGKLQTLGRINVDASVDILATYTYHANASSASYGQVATITNGAGAVTQYLYDSSTGALQSTILPDNNMTNRQVAYVTDQLYQVAQVTDQAGSVTALLYDASGRTQRVQAPDPKTGQPSTNFATNYAYDAVDTAGTGSSGPLVISTVTDPNGRVTSRYTDAEGKVWKVVDAQGNTTTYSYLSGGLLGSITDANGNVTSYAYDGFDRLRTVTDPYGKATTYAYYADGKLHTRTDAKGQTLTYAYNNLGQLLTKSYSTGGVITFTYAGDRVSTVTDTYHPQVKGLTQAYTYTYDTRHRLTSAASPTGTANYTYADNAVDQIATVSDGTKTWQYAYYPDGSLQTITAPEGAYTYTYNAVGQPIQVGYPAATGLSPTYEYDAQHRLTTVFNYAGSRSIWPSRHDYVYDEVRNGAPVRGMITSVRESFMTPDGQMIGGLQPLTTSYDYDSLYQLTQAVYPAPTFSKTNAAPWFGQTHTWTYDAIGNRKRFTKYETSTGNVLGDLQYLYNLGDKGPQLVRITGDAGQGFAYDANGNVVIHVRDGIILDTTEYTWDADDKLVREVRMLGGKPASTADYTYAYNGDRLQRMLDGTAWTYLYSKEDILRVDQGVASALYLTQGPGIDDVLAETQGAKTQYAFKNMLSSVVALTDPAGAVITSHLYDAWGQANAWPAAAAGANPYGYTGREWDAPGMYYYRNRFYRPDIGRLLSKDRLRGNNLYAYAQNDPVLFTDPSGWQAAAGMSSSHQPAYHPWRGPDYDGTIPWPHCFPPSADCSGNMYIAFWDEVDENWSDKTTLLFNTMFNTACSAIPGAFVLVSFGVPDCRNIRACCAPGCPKKTGTPPPSH